MIYKYMKLVVALFLGMLAIGQLTIAVRAYESKVNYEILLGEIGLSLRGAPGGNTPVPPLPLHSDNDLRGASAPVVSPDRDRVAL